jgi:hypothetical protein
MERGRKKRIIKAGNLILKGELCFELKEIVREVSVFGWISKSFYLFFIKFYLYRKFEFRR